MGGAVETVGNTFSHMENNIAKVQEKVFNNTVGQVFGDKLNSIRDLTTNTAFKNPGNFINNANNNGVGSAIGESLGTSFREVKSDFIAPIIGGIKGPQAPADPGPAQQSPDQIAAAQAARDKQNKSDEEKRLLAKYPGRGGVLQNQAPTFRFT